MYAFQIQLQKSKLWMIWRKIKSKSLQQQKWENNFN